MNDFLKDLKNRNIRFKVINFIFSLGVIIFFVCLSFKILKDIKNFLININKSKIDYSIGKSFLYKNEKKYHDITKEEYTDLFSYRLIVKNEFILDLEQWNLFLRTIPNEMKRTFKDHTLILGFNVINQANLLAKKLKDNNIIEKYIVEEPKVDIKRFTE